MKYLIGLILFVFFASCSETQKNKKYIELKNKIEEGLDKEQKLRREISKKKEFDATLNNQMGQLDSINHLYVVEYLDLFGYPSISEHGEKLCNGVFYILQHNDHQTMEKYIGALKEKAFEGEASKIHYALMQDRILEQNNQKQIYGTQIVPRKNSSGYITNEYYVWPIQNVKIVDSLRKQIGFKKTIREYADDMDAEFNENEQLPNNQ